MLWAHHFIFYLRMVLVLHALLPAYTNAEKSEKFIDTHSVGDMLMVGQIGLESILPPIIERLDPKKEEKEGENTKDKAQEEKNADGNGEQPMDVRSGPPPPQQPKDIDRMDSDSVDVVVKEDPPTNAEAPSVDPGDQVPDTSWSREAGHTMPKPDDGLVQNPGDDVQTDPNGNFEPAETGENLPTEEELEDIAELNPEIPTEMLPNFNPMEEIPV